MYNKQLILMAQTDGIVERELSAKQQLPLSKYSPTFIRVAIQAGEIKIINSEVVRAFLSKPKTKGCLMTVLVESSR